MEPQVAIYFDLEKPIRVTSEVLGKSLSAEIDGRAIELHWPEVIWENFVGMPRPRLQPPVNFTGLPLLETTLPAGNRGWGNTLTFYPDNRSLEGVEVYRICLSLDTSSLDGLDVLEPHPFMLDKWLNHKLPPFFHSLSDWIEIWTKQIGAPAARAHRMPTFGLEVTSWRRNGDTWREPRRTQEATVGEWNYSHPMWGVPANLVQIQRAIELVSQNQKPDFEDLLHRDARESWATGEPRKAVLEAGLAVELVLSPLYQNKRSNASSNVERQIFKNQDPTLGGLITALRKVGVDLPSRIVDPLLATRNLAAHHAVTITEEQTNMALILTDEIFELFYPNSNPIRTS